MSKYQTALEMMEDRFKNDSIIAIATTDENGIHNRMVDAFFYNGAFYVSTYALSNKMIQIDKNPNVAIAALDWFSAQAQAKNLGWVLDPSNADIRNKMKETFEWYEAVNNEKDKNCCILEIKPIKGMLIKDHHAIRYQIDFENQKALLSKNFGKFQ